MTQRKQIFKCEVCGNIVEGLHTGDGELVCCGQPMKVFQENTIDASKEKHIPVIDRNRNEVKVKVGSTPHPMEEKHYVEWIEIIDGDKYSREFLKPGQAPEAVFESKSAPLVARGYCNIHGLWKG